MNEIGNKARAQSDNSESNDKPVSVRHWYAVYTKPRHEKKVNELLSDQKIECYLPLVRQRRRWTQRQAEVDEPLIRGYVFVQIGLEQMLYVLQTYGVVRFVMFSKELAVVPDFQIEALKRFLAGGFTLLPINYMQVGQFVEVIEGPLKGVIGKIQNINNQDKFVLTLDAVQAAYTIQVDPRILAPLPPQKKKKIFTLPLGF